MDTRNLAMAMGAVRTGIGASLVVAPSWSARVWIGHDTDGRGTKVFARTLGARDIALGTATLASSDGDSDRLADLIKIGAAMDLADMAATVVAFRNFEGRRKWLMPLMTVAMGAASAAIAFAGASTGGDAPRKAQDGSGGNPANRPKATDPASEAGIVDQQGAILEQVDGVAESAASNGARNKAGSSSAKVASTPKKEKAGQDTATGTDPDARYEQPGYEDKSFGQAVNQDQELAERLDKEFDSDEAERRFTEESAGAPVLAEQDKPDEGS
ncbi:MAG: hypothetical protein WBF71_07425 [Microthrixaceae bacterium]